MNVILRTLTHTSNVRHMSTSTHMRKAAHVHHQCLQNQGVTMQLLLTLGVQPLDKVICGCNKKKNINQRSIRNVLGTVQTWKDIALAQNSLQSKAPILQMLVYMQNFTCGRSH